MSDGHREYRRDDGVVLSSDPALLDFDVIHGFLSRSTWSPGIARERVERAARQSLAYGLYGPDGAQIGYARVVTDGATIAYLADVFVLEALRGRGLGAWMVEKVVGDPALADLRRWMLFTTTAPSLYARFGFRPIGAESGAMVRLGGGAPTPGAA